MSYQFNTLYSTDKAFNCDVIKTDEEIYMGRLYILPTEDLNLQKLGIQKEWFLAHQSGEFLTSGHINSSGEWSLSSYKSLEPSFVYTSQNQIFDRIFSDDYVQFLSQLRTEETSITSELNVSKSENFDGEEDNISGDSQTVQANSNFINSTTNVDLFRNLLLRTLPAELLELQENMNIYEETAQHSSFIEQQKSTNQVSLQPITIIEEKSESIDLFAIQNAVIDAIINKYQQEENNEFILSPLGVVTIKLEDDYFLLQSQSDEHTIIAATLSKEVIDELKLCDVKECIEFLSALKDSNLETLLVKDKSSGFHVNEINKSTGIEYGS